MALLERAQIELNDITDAQPAVLTLAANLSRVQTEDGVIYSPDYSKDDNLIITPTLYVGAKLGNIDPENIVYTTNNGDFGIKDTTNGSYKISQNLVNINSVIITATISNDAPEGAGATAQIELVKLSSSSNKYTAIISSEDDKTIFTPTDRKDIELKAELYLGNTLASGEISYQWYKNGASLGNDPEKSTHTVTAAAINSMSNYYCIITAGGNSYPTSSITIMDKTDPYSAQIISSSGLIFTSNTESTTLTCKVYQSNVEITNNITYKWYKISTNGRTEVPNETKSVSITADLSEQSVTYYCEATINGTTTALAQISLMTAPKFNTVISPKQIFLPFKGEVYQGGDSYILTFYLTAANGSKIDPTKYSIAEIKLGTKSNEYFKASSKVSGEDTIITINRKEEIKSFPDSEICSISYTYMKVTFEEEFYFVKNISGENGEEGKKGEDGNGIKDIEISYARSNDGTRPPKDNVEGVETNWYTLIEQIPPEKLKLQFLWEKKVTHFTNTTETVTEYSVSNNGREIEKIVEHYALGLYLTKKGVYVKEIKYSPSGEKVAITQEGDEVSIFYDDGTLRLDKNNNIIDKNKKPIFYSSDFIFISAGRLYPEKAEWLDTVPVNQQEIVNTGGEVIDVLINDNKTLYFISALEEQVKNKNSLWIKYEMIYTDGTFGTTIPTLLEEMNKLRLSASRAETIYNNGSIQSIVQTTNWGSDENGMPYTLATKILQMPNSILHEVITKNDFSKYFKMGSDGLTIGATDSFYATFADENGFNIRFYPQKYNPISDEQDFKNIGTFDSSGLNVPQITLQNEFDSKNENNLNNIIILKGTSRGGWAWVKGSARR